ncbi:MAG: PHP domain-containing protein [Candidatus Omnitrophica bacterium]|nr:PHP domain-containing protein [Candidatus Omnitrophota bacterium]
MGQPTSRPADQQTKIKYADLHLHSTFSDGTFSPEELVNLAQGKGLCCIAITDHDEVSAIAPASAAGKSCGLEVIPGVELSAEIDDCEVHILGYFIDWQASWFQQRLEKIRAVREKRIFAITEKLKSFGIDLDPEQILRQAHPGSVGRLHIARLLKEKGYVASIPEAFSSYLGNDRPCYVKKFKLTPGEAIEMIRQVNGLSVLAHPYHLSDDKITSDFVRWGIRGLEAYYPEHTPAATEHYLKLAEKNGLLVTGGSDCHGFGKDKSMLGAVKIPYQLVQALKAEVGAS